MWPLLVALAGPPLWGFGLARVLHGVPAYFRYVYWLGGCAGVAVANVSPLNWVALAVDVVSAVVAAVLLWRSRRGGRGRVGRLLGAKSRGLLAALVRRGRAAVRPGGVLRPVPGGVA